MKKYLDTFDECLALKTVDGAKKANIIRDELFKIYGSCMTLYIHNTSDIETIRGRINEMKPK
jgi:hypothetical protein